MWQGHFCADYLKKVRITPHLTHKETLASARARIWTQLSWFPCLVGTCSAVSRGHDTCSLPLIYSTPHCYSLFHICSCLFCMAALELLSNYYDDASSSQLYPIFITCPSPPVLSFSPAFDRQTPWMHFLYLVSPDFFSLFLLSNLYLYLYSYCFIGTALSEVTTGLHVPKMNVHFSAIILFHFLAVFYSVSHTLLLYFSTHFTLLVGLVPSSGLSFSSPKAHLFSHF